MDIIGDIDQAPVLFLKALETAHMKTQVIMINNKFEGKLIKLGLHDHVIFKGSDLSFTWSFIIRFICEIIKY
jgi:hypothetical protein